MEQVDLARGFKVPLSFSVEDPVDTELLLSQLGPDHVLRKNACTDFSFPPLYWNTERCELTRPFQSSAYCRAVSSGCWQKSTSL